jgi:uncharacterized pyridoxamine 5'-phosphate oxidase family protein
MENSAKVREYLRECGVFYIATEDARQPRVRPLNGIYLYEGKLCIFTPKDSPLYKRLNADGNLCDASGQILDFRYRKAQ